jgi:hypothetical protein
MLIPLYSHFYTATCFSPQGTVLKIPCIINFNVYTIKLLTYDVFIANW